MSDPLLGEVCCFHKPRLRTRKRPDLIWPSDYCLLVLFPVGGDEATMHRPESIESVFRVLVQLGRESGAQVTFSFRLQAATLEEIDGLSLLIHDSKMC